MPNHGRFHRVPPVRARSSRPLHPRCRESRSCGASERSVTSEEIDMATEGQTLEQQLEGLLEQEKCPPPDGLSENAVVADPAIYEQAEDYEAFWAERAEALHWDTKWDQVLDWSNP